MISNFEFLTKDQDTQILYETAKNAESLYFMGMFSNEFESIRKVMEYVARQILDFNYIQMDDRSSFNDCLREIRIKHLVNPQMLDDFYSLKGNGNKAAHTLGKYSKGESLDGLIKMHRILVWYANNYMDDNQDTNSFVEPRQEHLYQTAERKLIYVQTADNSDGQWPAYTGLEKIGDASIDSYEMDNRPNSGDLQDVASRRIRQYMGTAGVPYKLQWTELAYRKADKRWFRDYDVHEVLLRSGIKKKERGEGQEWFETDVQTAKKAIQAVKEGKKSIDAPDVCSKPVKIILRPEQNDAVEKTEKAFKSNYRMLWNAKMRFGKTLAALELIKKQKYQHVLIMTHRPVVDAGWFDDFQKIGMPELGYIYGSKNEGENFPYLVKSGKPFIYFASLQDLRGSEVVGGVAGDKNRDLFKMLWDLVIVDEAHEGTQTELAKRVIDLVVKPEYTKFLELSGTPFNILDQYKEDQVYTWDYVMEQDAKAKWKVKHPDLPNPYDGLPKVSMYTFEMNKSFKNSQFVDDGKQSFNFKEFFRVNDDGKFVYEDKVNQFLTNISSPDKRTNYPFSTKKFRNQLRHTLWILPGVKEANALEDLMNKHAVFGLEYDIVNVVRDVHGGKDNGFTSESDIVKVKDAIGKDAAVTKTITLTVRKMTTGVTIKPWTGVVFLSNTNSAMQYLQAAFRAQTPYSSPTFGKKTNCYIFDFAPDRALTILAESTQLNTGVGKRTNGAQKEKMSELMNFLPIIGESNQGMRPFKIDTLLAKIKRVYAEKAVRTGFDDSSLYSDELLMLKDTDLKAFNDLKAIVGTTKADKRPVSVDVNKQGLTDEEYDQSVQGERKPKRERTADEEAAIEKVKELKKQRKTLISVLRSVSIRIPMMIYGMDVDLGEDITIHKFVNKIDEKSWKEFMPKGVTKLLFLKFSRYYDQDVFIEAGRIIRNHVKKLDNLDLIERTEQLASIFGTFRNPDKETVLTPWRVVNIQLGKTIGGLSFYDDSYQYTTTNGGSAVHWIDTKPTDKIFNQESHILEINSKTGLYPLYAAMSLYWLEYQRLINDLAGKFSIEDELLIWQKILRKNIFIVAKTPMAAAITKRTLSGYRTMDMNIEFVDNIVEDAKMDVEAEAKKIRRLFNNMKFNVVVGNPPYQETTSKKTSKGQQPVQNIFQYFQELADSVSANYSSLIYPGKRWIHQSGKGMKTFGYKQMNSPHLSKLTFYEDATQVFKDVAIGDGLSIVFKDYGKTSNEFDYEYIGRNGKIDDSRLNMPGKKLLILNPDDRKISDRIDEFVAKNGLDYINNSPAINRQLFKIESDFVEKNPDKVRLLTTNTKIDASTEIKLLTNDKAGKAGRAKWYVSNRNVIKSHQDMIDEWQVVVSSANAGGQKRDNQMQIIDNQSAFGRVRVALKSFTSKVEAQNFFKYANSYIVRFAFLLTDEALTSLGKEVPDLLDYTSNNKYINFDYDVDSQLVDLLGLSSDQFKYIQDKVNI